MNASIGPGRGSHFNPPNRFALTRYDDSEPLDYTDEEPDPLRKTVYYPDRSKSIVSENDSPDVGCRYTLNPYRGCSHGCSYCFARPTHEYLDLGAGIDFESKIFVKERASDLLRDWLARDGYRPECIMISGVTDCYQPAERHFGITRRCVAVALEALQPLNIVTKNALVLRDLDLLTEMAQHHVIRVAVSLTTLDQKLAKVMEPRTSSPDARLRAIAKLTSAGIPVVALLAPVIPGLNDSEIPALLCAARDAGAVSAGYVLLRLPLSVEPVFFEWLQRTHPEKRSKIEARIRSTRGDKLYESAFGVRMRGQGQMADQIEQTFHLFARKFHLDQPAPALDTAAFRKPKPSSGQGWLFNDWA
jgi:DNA repair photolyase